MRNAGSSRRLFVAAAAVAFLAFGTSSLRASILYGQPPLLSGGLDLGGFYSQNDTNGGTFDTTTFDDFSLVSAATIESLTWVGSYVGGTGTITGFTISIWGNNSGVPDYTDPALYSTTVSGNAGETFVQDDFFGNPTYSYAANMNFTASAGTEYWLSIVPDLSSPPRWTWETGSGGDGVGYQVFGTLSSPTSDGAIKGDLTFTLYDTAVPEPATIGLMCAGLLLLGFASRRSRSSSS